jgi:hypothetical protein
MVSAKLARAWNLGTQRATLGGGVCRSVFRIPQAGTSLGNPEGPTLLAPLHMEGSKMFFMRKTRRRRSRSTCCRHCRGGLLGWVRPTALTTFLGLLGAAGNIMPTASVPAASAQPQKVQPAGFAAPAPTPQSPLDQPLRLIAEAQQAYMTVYSYECVLISQERVNGKLQPQKVMQMTFRKNPFSVYMKWLAPKEDLGQEVCFVEGRNQNAMKVLPAGLFKGMGWKTIQINDPMVMQHSRHTIMEAGFGNWIDRFGKSWAAERITGKTQVQTAEYEYNKRRCIRVETIHTARDRLSYCYRTVIYFDVEKHLPVRLECYDWPRQGGPPEGELLECFSYINLNFNIPIQEALFDH